MTATIAHRGRLATAGAVGGRPTVGYITTAVVGLWATWPFWWPGRSVVAFDTATYSAPNLVVTIDAWRDGRLALWNDAIFGGVTHLGNPQAGALYPPRLLALVTEPGRAIGLLAAGHVVLLGLGMVALARRLGLGRWPSTFVGVAAVLNGAVLTKATQLEQILVLGWAPWVLLATYACLTCARATRAIAAMAAVTAAVLLAGHPQLVFEIALVAIAFGIGVVTTGDRWRRLPALAAGLALGAVIASPQLLAAAVATSQSIVRSGRDPQDLADAGVAVSPGSFARAVLGTVADVRPDVFAGSVEAVGFVGVVVIVLAVVGAIDALRTTATRRWAIGLLVIASLAVVWSMGPRSFVFDVAFDVLPGFDLARVSARWVVICALVACLFAGFGVHALALRPSRRVLGLTVAAVVVASSVILVRRLDGGDVATGVEWAVLALLAMAGVAMSTGVPGRARSLAPVAVAALAAVSLGAAARHSLPQQLMTDGSIDADLGTATTDWLVGQPGYVISLTDDLREPAYTVPGLRPNAHVLVGLRSIDGYDGGVQLTDRWAAALRRLRADPVVDLPLRNNLVPPLDPTRLGRLGVRFVLVDRTRRAAELVPGWIGPQAVDERFEVWENPDWPGEAIAWRSATVVDPQTVPDLLRTQAGELADVALVDELDRPLDCAAATQRCAPVGLTVDRSTPERLVVRADLDAPSLVTISQQYDAGWHVSVDGAADEVVLVDDLFMGVEVGPGRHVVEWSYRPRWLTGTLGLAAAATVTTVLLAVPWSSVRGRRRRPAAAP